MKRKITFLIAAFFALTMIVSTGTVWGETVKYTISSKNTLTTTGTAPTSSTASIVETYGTSCQMTGGNSQTVTLTNYYGYSISNITLSMKSNKSGGAGKLSYSTDGGATYTYIVGSSSESVAFNQAAWNGAWSTSYVDISKDVTIVPESGKNLIIKIEATANSLYCQSYQLTYTTSGGGTPTCETPTFSPTENTYTSAQSVTISTETGGATIYYTTDGSTPTTSSNVYSSAISVSATQTIKAIAVKDGYNNSSVATANYYILGHAGSALDPYTVADARTAIDGNNTTYMNSKYATGKVTGIVTAYTAENGVTFDMIDEGTPDKVLRAYRCKGDDAEKVLVGDVVVVSGDLYLYSSKSETATVYEFKENCHLVSYVHYPTINVNKNSLTGFTYTLDNGPSTAQNFTVSGTTLSDDITLSLGLSSSFEMSLSEGSSYTNSLTLTPTTGTVAATTIYVRLKAGLDVNVSYNGTITLTSTGATDRTISLTGSVTEPSFSWNLGTNSYDASPTESLISWTH